MKQDPDKHARRGKERCKPTGEGKEISFQLWIYTHTDTVYQLAYSLFGLTLINPVMVSSCENLDNECKNADREGR